MRMLGLFFIAFKIWGNHLVEGFRRIKLHLRKHFSFEVLERCRKNIGCNDSFVATTTLAQKFENKKAAWIKLVNFNQNF